MSGLRINKLWFETALLEAKKSNIVHKCGAVLIYRNKIVSKGYNFYRCDRVSSSNKNCCFLCA
jgi:deoxycytidylate deaminase